MRDAPSPFTQENDGKRHLFRDRGAPHLVVTYFMYCLGHTLFQQLLFNSSTKILRSSIVNAIAKLVNIAR